MAYDDCEPMAVCESKAVFESPEYEAFWDARMEFQRAMDLADRARSTPNAVRIYRLSLALAQEKCRDMSNALMLLEKKAMEEEEALQQPPSTW